MSDDIHSCSYFCDRPACIKAQRDELRDALAARPADPVEPTAMSQFLTDVTTAAGLLAHGKQDKGLAARIGKFAFDLRLATPPAQHEPSA